MRSKPKLLFFLSTCLPCSVLAHHCDVWGGAAAPAYPEAHVETAAAQQEEKKETAPQPGEVEATVEVGCDPVVEGRKCPLGVNVKNATEDLVIVSSLGADGPGDERTSLLVNRYGGVHERQDGSLEYNSMQQTATPKVFFDRGALLLPGEAGAYSLVTRFFEGGRTVTLRYYRIAPDEISGFIFAPGADTAGLPPAGAPPMTGGADQRFHPVQSEERFKDPAAAFILWNKGELVESDIMLKASPDIRQAPFSLAEAKSEIADHGKVKSVSYSDTFDRWILQTPGGTWLVGREGKENIGRIGALVFEKIDEKNGEKVRFRVPEELFGDAYTLEDGDGMYTVGKFVIASRNRILDVLRTVKAGGLGCFVSYYFFESWYLDVQ